MKNISMEHSDRLFWLGRYTERFFTTIKSLERLYDKVLDKDKRHYEKYLECLNFPNTYSDYKSFFESFLFNEQNPCSAAFLLERAYDNAIVLREEISTEALAYLQEAKDTLKQAEKVRIGMVISLLPLIDNIYGFWGCLFDNVLNEEIKGIILCGKNIERLEMFIRLKYRPQLIKGEYERLCSTVEMIPENSPYQFDAQRIADLGMIIGKHGHMSNRENEALNILANIFCQRGEEKFV